MYKASLNNRLRYAFDNTMSKGTIALIGLLAVLSTFVIIVVALFVTVVGITPEGGQQLSFPKALWQSLMRTLDSGTMGGDVGWNFRIAMLVVTFGGIFVISTLIGVLTSGTEGKIEDLRKGRREHANHIAAPARHCQPFREPLHSSLGRITSKAASMTLRP